MHRGTWKQLERQISAWFGVLRQPLSGSAGRADRTAADMLHPAIFNEIKLRQSVGPLFRAMVDVKAQAKKEGRVPMIMLPGKDRSVRDEAVVLFSDDLVRVANIMAEPVHDGFKLLRQIHLAVVPKLGNKNSVFEKAKDDANREEGKCLICLTCKEPRRQGFLIVTQFDMIPALAVWRCAALRSCAQAGVDIPSFAGEETETRQFWRRHGETVREYASRLVKYKHSLVNKKGKNEHPKPEEPDADDTGAASTGDAADAGAATAG